MQLLGRSSCSSGGEEASNGPVFTSWKTPRGGEEINQVKVSSSVHDRSDRCFLYLFVITRQRVWRINREIGDHVTKTTTREHVTF